MPDSSRPCLRSWRRRTASGAVVTAMALGIRHAVDDRTGAEAVVAPAPTERPGADEALELHFDARGPLDTWAVARPWLA